MFRTDVDLQIAGTTDVSNDTFFFSFSHLAIFSINVDGFVHWRFVTGFVFASRLLQRTYITQ